MVTCNILDDGFEGIFYSSDQKNTACIVISGSDGGISWAKQIAKQLSSLHIASLAVAYWGTKQTPKALSLIPVETIQSAVCWLLKQGYHQVGIYGFSKGAELALLSASLIPELHFVIAISPACCVMEGIKKPFYSGASSWTWKRKPFPYISVQSVKTNPIKNLLKYGEFGLTNEYQKMISEQLNETNAIKVEKIQGNILLLSAQEDAQWNSEEMSTILMDRLEINNFNYSYQSKTFYPASHILCPIHTIFKNVYRIERKYPKECEQARKKAFQLAYEYILNI